MRTVWADYYHAEVFGEEHWKALENQIALAAELGINMLLTPVFTPPLDTAEGTERTTVQLVDISEEDDGYRFDSAGWKDGALCAGNTALRIWKCRICLPSGERRRRRRFWSGQTDRWKSVLAGMFGGQPCLSDISAGFSFRHCRKNCRNLAMTEIMSAFIFQTSRRKRILESYAKAKEDDRRAAGWLDGDRRAQ